MLFSKEIYKKFLDSQTKNKWEKIGIKRRAGVLVPLFSIYSKNSTGIGDFFDLKILVDWCKKCGLSIIQLLPLNDTGYKFTPYDCISTFAIEPAYINLYKLNAQNLEKFLPEIEKLKEKFILKERVNYEIKKEKLKILWEIFKIQKEICKEYETYVDKNAFWINDYAIFTVLKEKNNQSAWEQWEIRYKEKDEEQLGKFQEENFDRINFFRWLQWQAYLQLKEIKEYANKNGVFILGDIPFLVSRDSADVWANRKYFKLNLASGAPPDMYFAKGQRWGMPPYNWEEIEKENFVYLKEKLKYTENFYDMFRIDHFVGLFRIWTIELSEPENTFGLNGKFDPEDEKKWEKNGQKILNAMLYVSDMLPCAEDLGVVPQCSFDTLKKFSIPGIDVQRWMRDWGKTYEFKKESEYRENSVSVISSHDMTLLICWWEEEAGKVDKALVEKLCNEYNFSYKEILEKLFEVKDLKAKRLRWKSEINSPEKVLETLKKTRDEVWMFYDLHRETFDEKEKFLKYLENENLDKEKATKEFVRTALIKCMKAKSIFSIQNIFDFLSLGDYFNNTDKWDLRINTPGIISDKNWNLLLPLSLEELLNADINNEIKKICEITERS